jgi:hypothetical protein
MSLLADFAMKLPVLPSGSQTGRLAKKAMGSGYF